MYFLFYLPIRHIEYNISHDIMQLKVFSCSSEVGLIKSLILKKELGFFYFEAIIEEKKGGLK